MSLPSSKRMRTSTVLRPSTNADWKSFAATSPDSPPQRVQTSQHFMGGGTSAQDTNTADFKRKIALLEAKVITRNGEVHKLNESLRLKEAECIKSKSDLSSIRLKLEFEKTQREREHNERLQEIEAASETVAEIERKCRFHANGESRLQSELNQLETTLGTSREKCNKRIKNLEDEKHELRRELAEIKEQRNSLDFEQKHTRSRLRADDSAHQAELEALRSESENERQNAQQAMEKLNLMLDVQSRNSKLEHAVEELKSQLQTAQSKSGGENGGSAEVVRRIRKLERENERLSKAMENNLLLQQQLSSTRDQLVRATRRAEKCATLETELHELQRVKASWEQLKQAMGTDVDVISSPDQLGPFISDLKLQLTLSSAKTGKLETDNKAIAVSIRHLENQLRREKMNAQSLVNQNQEITTQLANLEGKLVFARKERDGMKEIFQVYHESAKKGNDASGVDQRKQESKLLQASLTEQRDINSKLEQQLEVLGSELASIRALKKNNAHNTTADDMQVDTLNEPNEEEQDPYYDFDPKKTKILRMKINPVSSSLAKRSAELERLRSENFALQLQLKTTPNANTLAGADGLTPKTSSGPVSVELAKELEELRVECTKLKTKNDRLRQAYQQTVQEFRDACYELSGYRMDVLNQKQYRLQSMYAEDPDDSLLFQSSPEGMQMLHTPFSSTVQEQIDGYLVKFNSIPAFLGAVTMELFSRQTMR
eukprot:m.74604 g.74604  ORF g.74604 m.74604 type:complete len:716 (-) comp24680_c0_seq1:239-2386(-)